MAINSGVGRTGRIWNRVLDGGAWEVMPEGCGRRGNWPCFQGEWRRHE